MHGHRTATFLTHDHHTPNLFAHGKPHDQKTDRNTNTPLLQIEAITVTTNKTPVASTMTSDEATGNGGSRKRKSRELNLPELGPVQFNSNGCAILPSDFLSGLKGTLANDWFAVTLPYYPYFDNKQRDAQGNGVMDLNMISPTQYNIDGWMEMIGQVF